MEIDSKGGFVFGFKSVSVNWQCLRTSWREGVHGHVHVGSEQGYKTAMLAEASREREKSRVTRLGPGEEQRSQGLGKQHGNYIWNSAATWLGDIGMLID